MGKMPRSYLQLNEFMKTNDYLVSDNGFFFAIMQTDGNLCVYRGGGPEDKHDGLWCTRTLVDDGKAFAIMQNDRNLCVYKGAGPQDQGAPLWASGQLGKKDDKVFAIMQDDGNLVIYGGTGPGDQQGGLWNSGEVDPVQSFEIERLDYDVDKSKVVQTRPHDLYRQELNNETSVEQTSSIGGSETLSESSGWTTKFGFKVGTKINFKTGIPIVAEGKIEVSAEVSSEFTWNGSTTRSKTWQYSAQAKVGPRSKVLAVVGVTVSDIIVPFTVKGEVVLRSGRRLRRELHGTYDGTSSHNLTVNYYQQAPAGGYKLVSHAPAQAVAAVGA
jgi:hypothetical protein